MRYALSKPLFCSVTYVYIRSLENKGFSAPSIEISKFNILGGTYLNKLIRLI